MERNSREKLAEISICSAIFSNHHCSLRSSQQIFLLFCFFFFISLDFFFMVSSVCCIRCIAISFESTSTKIEARHCLCTIYVTLCFACFSFCFHLSFHLYCLLYDDLSGGVSRPSDIALVDITTCKKCRHICSDCCALEISLICEHQTLIRQRFEQKNSKYRRSFGFLTFLALIRIGFHTWKMKNEK